MQHLCTADLTRPATHSEVFAPAFGLTVSLDNRSGRPNHAAQMVVLVNKGTSFETINVTTIGDEVNAGHVETVTLAPGERYPYSIPLLVLHGTTAGADVTATAFWWRMPGSEIVT